MFETLFVLVVVGALLVAAATGWQKSWRSQQVLAAAMRLTQDLHLARSLAIKRGHPVELRLYRTRDVALTAPGAQYKSWQLVGYDPVERRLVRLGEIQRFESTVIMSGIVALSSIVATERPYNIALDPPPAMLPCDISAIEFRPDGSTNLDPDPVFTWTLTLLTDEFAEETLNLPPDFRTLIITPENGAVTIH